MALDRNRRDEAGVGPDPQLTGGLTRLSKADFKIAGGDADIRGWEVRTLAGIEVGKIEDLLIDPHRGEVVMLEIDLTESDNNITLPIRGVQLDRDRKCVIVDSGDVRSARESLMDDRNAEIAVAPENDRAVTEDLGAPSRVDPDDTLG